MKRLKMLFLALVLGLSVFSCKKENNIMPEMTTLRQTFTQKSNWSSAERAFFSLERKTNDAVQSRSKSNLVYNPLLVKAYNQIAEENEQRNFIDDMVKSAGYPIWERTFIHTKDPQQDFLLIPMAKIGERKLTGFIAMSRSKINQNSDFVINGVTRQQLLNVNAGDARQKLPYLKKMMEYEYLLFKETDLALQDCMCKYKDKIEELPPGTPLPPVTCQWTVVEICIDLDYQVGWAAGSKIPLYLDHDQDGIHNNEDPDWQLLLQNSGKTNQEMVDLILAWWEDNYEAQYGDIDDYWEEYSNGDGVIIDFSVFQEIMDAVGDYLDDLWHDIGREWHELEQWWDDLHIHCPHPSGGKGGVVDREVRCDKYLMLDCGNGINWENLFLCPECDQWSMDERERLRLHWTNKYQGSGIEFDDLFNIANEAGCQIYSPTYEQCVDQAFTRSYIQTPPPPDKVILDLKTDLNRCFGTSCSNCTYSITLYIEQPVPGTRNLYGGGGSSSGKNGGHVFIGLTQTDALGNSVSKTIGYYPTSRPSGREEVPGFWYNENNNTIYNISVTYNVTEAQFQTIRTNLGNVYTSYQVERNNCATTITQALQAAGINIPETPRHQFPLGTLEANPADLGEDLRNNPQGGTFNEVANGQYAVPPLSSCL